MSLIQKVRNKELTPEEALRLSLKHSTDIGDVDLDLTSDILPSGFDSIDEAEYLCKDRGRLIVIGGLPGSGKTAFSFQLAGSIAKTHRVLFFSFEMSKESLKERHLALLSKVPLKELRYRSDSPEVKAAQAEQKRLKLSVVDTPGLNINSLIQMAVDEHQRECIDLIIVDYLGLFEVDDKNRPIEMGKVAEALKFKLAEKLKIPVVVLSQLNDEFEKRYLQFQVAQEKAKFYDGYRPVKNAIRPVLSDLAETRKLGRAADVVMFIHRPYTFDSSLDPATTEVFVCKNRNGMSKDFKLEYDPYCTRFYNPKEF